MDARQVMRWAGVCCLLTVIGWSAAAPAGAAPARAPGTPTTCTGTQGSPGVLAGSYPSGAVVTGFCDVSGGVATVHGTLTIASGATLDGTYAHNHTSGTGGSSLTVTGNVKVAAGATLVIGCEPEHLPCSDDPGGTLSSLDHIGGNLVARHALGVVVHATSVGGSVTQSTGGGGVTCDSPPGSLFAQIGTGAYSDYEDDTIGGSLHVTGLRTCWIGILRNDVTHNLVDSHNSFSDPDANETMQNAVGGNIACTGNSPAVQYGDSSATPNVVKGHASGECTFTPASGPAVSVKG